MNYVSNHCIVNYNNNIEEFYSIHFIKPASKATPYVVAFNKDKKKMEVCWVFPFSLTIGQDNGSEINQFQMKIDDEYGKQKELWISQKSYYFIKKASLIKTGTILESSLLPNSWDGEEGYFVKFDENSSESQLKDGITNFGDKYLLTFSNSKTDNGQEEFASLGVDSTNNFDTVIADNSEARSLDFQFNFNEYYFSKFNGCSNIIIEYSSIPGQFCRLNVDGSNLSVVKKETSLTTVTISLCGKNGNQSFLKDFINAHSGATIRATFLLNGQTKKYSIPFCLLPEKEIILTQKDLPSQRCTDSKHNVNYSYNSTNLQFPAIIRKKNDDPSKIEIVNQTNYTFYYRVLLGDKTYSPLVMIGPKETATINKNETSLDTTYPQTTTIRMYVSNSEYAPYLEQIYREN